MADTFTITYQIDDGYAGVLRPQTVHVNRSEIEGEHDAIILRQIFWDLIREDFENNIHTYSEDETPFIEWARKKTDD